MVSGKMPSQFVDTSFIASGSDEGSEPEAQDKEGDDSDALDLLELLAEMWVTVGVAAPLFLFIISLVMLIMSGDGVMTLWLAPTTIIGATALVVAALRFTGQPAAATRSATDRELAELRSTLTMTLVVLWVSILVGLGVLGILQAQFVSELSTLVESGDVPAELGVSSGDLALVQTVVYAMGIAYILSGVVLTAVFRGGLRRPRSRGA